MTTKKQILKVLNHSESDYNFLVMDLFIAWCAEQQYSDNHFQLLLTNNKLYNWFLKEYAKREKSFLYVAKPFIGKVPVKDLRSLYDDKVTDIPFYPKAILKEILNQVKINATKPEYNRPARLTYNLN